jgi:hypothetical protein
MKIPLWLVLQTRAQFTAKGHSSPGLDGVTWRLLATIPINVVEHIRKAFEARLNASAAHRGPISDWSAVVVRLIAKTKCPRELNDWRPTSLSSCCQKWFCSILVCLLDAHARPLSTAATDFRPGRQVAEITESLKLLLEKAVCGTTTLSLSRLTFAGPSIR